MDFTDAYIDATCLNAGIRFPVDWVLAHNLRVLARRELALRQSEQQAA